MARLLPSPRTALAVLTGLNLLNYLDRFIPAAVLPAISRPTCTCPDTQAGLAAAGLHPELRAHLAGVRLAGRPARALPLAAIGVFVWSAATVGSGPGHHVRDCWSLARALTGVGEASYTVVTPSLISDFYPADRRGRALALFYAAIPIGSAVGYMIGGAIAAHWGWRAAFFVAGAPGAAAGAVLLMFRDPVRGAFDASRRASRSRVTAARHPRAPCARARASSSTPSAQTIYTFAVGGLAFWMPTYFVRSRGHLDAGDATLTSAVVLLLGRLRRDADRRARRRSPRPPPPRRPLPAVRRRPSSRRCPFTLLAILHPSPAIFWPAMFMTLLLLFINTGPLNAAMANVLPADLRGRGFAVNTLSIHVLGDAPSPLARSASASDRIGLQLPVLVTGLLLVVAGLVLLAGRRGAAPRSAGGGA